MSTLPFTAIAARAILPGLLILIMMTIPTQGKQLPDVAFEKFTLANGLRVILSVDTSAPVVVTFMNYHVGSKNEQSDRTGFAHFFEHLMFEGTENIPRFKINEMIQAVGGERNGTTTADDTYYTIYLPSNQLQLALWIESERMLHARIDEAGVETQRNVVKEERRDAIDNQPYMSAEQKLVEALGEGTPYSWLPSGTDQYIDRATIDEFREFYRTYYVPNNAVFAIVGNIDIARTRKLVEDYFGDIPRGKDLSRPSIEVKGVMRKRVLEVHEERTPLPGILYGYRVVPKGDPDGYPLRMLIQILATGHSSRLYRDLIDTRGIVLDISADMEQYEGLGILYVVLIGQSVTTVEGLAAELDREIAEVQQQGITARELHKARLRMSTEAAERLSDVRRKAQALATCEQNFGDPGVIGRELDRYLAVSRGDIKRVARKYLTPENQVVLKYPPHSRNAGKQ